MGHTHAVVVLLIQTFSALGAPMISGAVLSVYVCVDAPFNVVICVQLFGTNDSIVSCAESGGC